MKEIILYYSYTGNCKRQAEQLTKGTEHAVKDERKVVEIREQKRHGKFLLFLSDCPRAAMRKKVQLSNQKLELNDYDKITIVAPIWNGYPAPAFNSIVDLLPANKEVELYFCSGGGETPKSKEGTCQLITSHNCILTGYHDIKTGAIQF